MYKVFIAFVFCCGFFFFTGEYCFHRILARIFDDNGDGGRLYYAKRLISFFSFYIVLYNK